MPSTLDTYCHQWPYAVAVSAEVGAPGGLTPSKIAGTLKNTWPLAPALKSFFGLCVVVTTTIQLLLDSSLTVVQHQHGSL